MLVSCRSLPLLLRLPVSVCPFVCIPSFPPGVELTPAPPPCPDCCGFCVLSFSFFSGRSYDHSRTLPQHGQRPLMQFGWDPTFKALLASCWAEDPRDRPGFAFVHVRDRTPPPAPALLSVSISDFFLLAWCTRYTRTVKCVVLLLLPAFERGAWADGLSLCWSVASFECGVLLATVAMIRASADGRNVFPSVLTYDKLARSLVVAWIDSKTKREMPSIELARVGRESSCRLRVVLKLTRCSFPLARRNAPGTCTSLRNRRPCRLWSRRRAPPRVPRTRAPPGLAGWAAGAVRPPLPPHQRALGGSCRASSPGEGSLGRAPPRALLTGVERRAARASDDRECKKKDKETGPSE